MLATVSKYVRIWKCRKLFFRSSQIFENIPQKFSRLKKIGILENDIPGLYSFI